MFGASFLTVDRCPFKCPASLVLVGLGVALEALDPATAALPLPFGELDCAAVAYTGMSLLCRVLAVDYDQRPILTATPPLLLATELMLTPALLRIPASTNLVHRPTTPLS